MEPRVILWIISILVARSQRSGEACFQCVHQRHEVSEAWISFDRWSLGIVVDGDMVNKRNVRGLGGASRALISW